MGILHFKVIVLNNADLSGNSLYLIMELFLFQFIVMEYFTNLKWYIKIKI